ncbi:DUF4272 domain-containing protein [Actinomycetes bacterium NPDC127524]
MFTFFRNGIKRRKKSQKYLRRAGIPFNSNLPVLKDEIQIRTVDEIANRAMCICTVAAKGEGTESEVVKKIIQRYDLINHFTKNEKEFLLNDDVSEEERIHFSWKYEGYWVLLWMLGYVDELSYPNAICDVPFAVTQLSERTRETFIAEAIIRSKEELAEQADLIYNMHWAVRQAQIDGMAIPGDLNIGVVQERHYALNWLLGTENWDEVETHT